MPPKKSTEIELRELAEEVRSIKEVLETVGIQVDAWTSPEKAGKLLGVSRSTIVREIHEVEEKRILGRKSDLKYGRDYRKVGQTWQIHWRNWKRIVLDTPPDQRP